MTSEKTRPLLIVEDDLAPAEADQWSLDRFESATATIASPPWCRWSAGSRRPSSPWTWFAPDADPVSEGFKLLEQILAATIPTSRSSCSPARTTGQRPARRGAGAYDFFAKPFEPGLLNLTVERAFRLAELQAENKRLRAMHQPDALSGLMTRDPEMLKVCRTIEKVAGSNATVMLLGESGTGRKCWRAAAPGLRAQGRQVRRDQLRGDPENLLESELFGYEKGAFTGAAKTTLGKIEMANGGTLMLDEIGDLPFSLQAKLLRFLQERTIRAHRRAAGDPGRRAHRLCHAPGPQGADQGKPLPRGPVYRLAEIVVNIPPCVTGWAIPPCWRMPSCAASPRSRTAVR